MTTESWTHYLCRSCYRAEAGPRTPTRVARPPIAACCRCGRVVDTGVFYRAEPGNYLCRGEQGIHAEARVAKVV